MELISPRKLTGAQELKKELFLRAEELERLVTIYKLKLCGKEMASLNYGSELMEQSNRDVLEEQRGKFYDVYMRKREEKLREEWMARGAKKEEEMKAMMESLASTSSTMMRREKATESKNNNSRKTNSRKLSSASSFSQISATTTYNPIIRSSNSTSLKKENPNSLTGISNETTLQKNIARSQTSNDKISLVKHIKARRSQSFCRNSQSLGEPKDFMHFNYDHDTVTPPMTTTPPRHGAPKPLVRKNNGTSLTTGLTKAKLRIPLGSQAHISEESQLQEPNEILKEENEHIDSMMIKDVPRPSFDKESWNSTNHLIESSSHTVESAKSSISHIQNDVHNASDFDSSVETPRFDSATEDSHIMNHYMESEPIRVRKKWGSIQRPFVAVDASTHPIMDLTKGIKRFLKFGKRSGGIEMHKDKNYDQNSENHFFKNSKNSRIGQIPSIGCFNEDQHYEQVNMTHNPSHSASIKQKETHLLANSPKQRVLSSLPPFHVR